MNSTENQVQVTAEEGTTIEAESGKAVQGRSRRKYWLNLGCRNSGFSGIDADDAIARRIENEIGPITYNEGGGMVMKTWDLSEARQSRRRMIALLAEYPDYREVAEEICTITAQPQCPECGNLGRFSDRYCPSCGVELLNSDYIE